MLAESELTDQLSISLDYAGRIITITMGVASTSTCEGALVPTDHLKQFVTAVHIRHCETGPTYLNSNNFACFQFNPALF